MADNIKIEERVLDGDFVGPVTTEIDTKDFTGTVGLENSLLDGSGSEINIELSESMGVVGIDDLVEVKSEIDKSVNKAEASVEESQRQIDKANETIRNLDAISGQITNLVDTAKQAATTADNHAHDAQASETNAANSASEALSSKKAAKSSEKAAKTSQAAAKDSENKAKLSQDAASQKAREATAQADRAEQEADASLSSAKRSEQERVKAESAKSAAETARDQAAAKASDASHAAGNAYRSQQQALTSQNAAKSSETKAKASATAAANSASSMTQSVADARAARDVALQAQSDAEDARDVASGKATLATQKANAAASSASAASDSQAAAKSSEDNAADSENKAKTSETNAKASENAAKASQAAAKASQQAASSSQQSALRSSNEAKAARDAAKTSETKAKTSENNAKTSETNASSSAQKAERSNLASASSATASSESATASSESATAAKASQDEAKASETEAKASEKAAKASQSAASASQKSAQNFALIAGQNKDAAAGSAKAAKASENAAKVSENAAKVSETNAADSATRAAKSSSDASANQLAAKKSQDAAKVSETSAAASKNAAAASASQASKKASQSAASATAASDSAKAAAASATSSKGSAVASAGSASEAKEAETAAKKSRDEAESFAIEMRKGSVYRGTWNPNDGKYPTTPTTNSRWDVQLNNGQLEVDFDGKKWNWGDRLIYILDEKTFDIIESGTGVTSVNGDTGAVTVTPQNIGAARKTGEVFTGNVEITHGGDAELSVNAGTNKDAEFSLSEAAKRQGMYIKYAGSGNNHTYYGTRNNSNDVNFMYIPRGQNYPTFVGVPLVAATQPGAGNSLTRKDWTEATFVKKSGDQINGNLITTGYTRANNVQVGTLTSSDKSVLSGTQKIAVVGNDQLDKVDIKGKALTHNGNPVYSENNKPVPYDLGAVENNPDFRKYTRNYIVSKSANPLILGYEGNPVTFPEKSYYIRLYTKATATVTGATYYIKGNAPGAPIVKLVGQVGSGSNHPEVFYDSSDKRLKLRTPHTSNYTVVVYIEETSNDSNPWVDITEAYSTSNRPTWNSVTNKPSQATRWPTFSEVTGKPSKYPTDWDNVSGKPAMATRWPTWAEIGGKPSLFSGSWGDLKGKPNVVVDGQNVLNIGEIRFTSAGSSDAAGFLCTKESSKTHYDFQLSDDVNNDDWRWMFRYHKNASGEYKPMMTLVPYASDKARLTVNGGIYESGERVYSPNNKPSLTALGALGKTETASNANNLQGRTKDQIVAEARSGLTLAGYSYSKSESDNKYLTKTGKAADADKVDGIDSSRILYGNNQFGTMPQTNFNNNSKSGAIEMADKVSSNKPGRSNSWAWGWQTSHTSNSSTKKYGAQFVINQDSQAYYRVQSQDGSGTWATLYSTANKPTANDVGAVPKSGGSFTSNIKVSAPGTNRDALELNTGATNGGGVHIKMTDQSSGAQYGTFGYFHQDGSAYGGDAAFVIGTSPDTTKTNFVLTGRGNFKVGNNEVYHQGNKPTLEDVTKHVTVTKGLKLQANTWTTLLGKSDSLTETGVYQILINYTSAGKGGAAYSQYYTGQFAWYANNTNNSNVAEIPLHHMGHADSGEYIYLRTHTRPGNKGDQTVDIKCNRAYSAAVDFTIKLVKIM
ncbi:YadA domain-containing protein [Vibrio phage KIT04]|nr:YadA domain-containing protein [Vibrio phage KIT04]